MAFPTGIEMSVRKVREKHFETSDNPIRSQHYQRRGKERLPIHTFCLLTEDRGFGKFLFDSHLLTEPRPIGAPSANQKDSNVMSSLFARLRKSLAVLAVLALSGSVFAADLLDQIKERGEITIGTEGTYAPFTYHDDKGALTGYDVEVGREIARRLGVKARFIETTWDGMIAGLDAKRYDIVINQVGPNPERRVKYDFSVPYTYDHGVMIVRKNNDDLKTFEEARGRVAAQGLNSNWTAFSRDELGARLTPVESSSQAFLLVESGRADFTMNSAIAFADFLKAKPNAALKAVARTKEAMVADVLVRKNNPELLKAIDEAILSMQKDGTLSRLSKEHLNTDVSQE